MNKYIKLTALAFAASLAFVASSSHATDGVYEINQACAAVGCFDGDAAGFPVEITKPGSYRLTSNLDNSDGTKKNIEITTPLEDGTVTLDLNGFSVTGACKGTSTVANCESNVTGSAAAVTVGVSSAHIKNGSITHARGSGLVGGFAQIKVSNVTFVRNAFNGIDGALSYLDVSDSVFTQNGQSGINGNSASNTVSHRSQFISNGAAGQVKGSCNNNVFSGNNGSGAEETCQLFMGTNVCDNAVCP